MSTLFSVPSAEDILSLYRSLSVFLPEVTEVNSFSHDCFGRLGFHCACVYHLLTTPSNKAHALSSDF